MEELIWKYIDNDCTEAEKQTVIHLLNTDETFNAVYLDLMQINTLLKDHAYLPLSDGLKVSLASSISAQVAQIPYAKTDVLPLKWILPLVAAAIITVVFALRLPDQSTPFFHVKIPMDDRSFSLATWVMMAFVCLMAIDFMLKKVHIFRRHMHVSL